jgi:ribonuclease D
MREYAAQDTLHLGTLQEQLIQELEAAGRVAWAEEEFRELEKVRFEEGGDVDPVSGVRAARALEPREVDRLREALLWRDRIAEAQDRALFRVASDAALVEVAQRSPSTVRELEEIQGVGVSLARRHGEELLLRLREVNRLGAQEVHGYPRARPGRNGSGRRPSPDVEARLGRLKAIRNRCASDLGIAKGTLLPNSVLQILAETPPPTQSALAGVPGVRSWQAALLAEELMKAM